jgi:hypothetical protein
VGFLARLRLAENYARRMEKDLQEARTATHQYQSTLAECTASLASSWETLNEERLDHQACREALKFETKKHRETIELLKDAMRSGEVADLLSSRRATLSVGQQSESMQQRQMSAPPKSHQLSKHERQTATGISNNPQPKSSSAYEFSSAATRSQKGSSGTGFVQA